MGWREIEASTETAALDMEDLLGARDVGSWLGEARLDAARGAAHEPEAAPWRP